jgi:peptide-methionine (S)-S-oxide reductase
MISICRRAAVLVWCAGLSACAMGATAASVSIPAPSVDAPLAMPQTLRTTVFAGGCFWGIQAVFQHVRGVTRAVSGYAGGTAATADYETVSGGQTGHAESVEVTYDASQVTFGQLLHVFFSVAHDPTELNRQGPDSGTQYRSAIFVADAEQQRIAAAYIAQLNDAGVFGRPIVTQLTAFSAFYPAEDDHQNYATRHPNDLYIRLNDAPKVENLRKELPQLYVSR